MPVRCEPFCTNTAVGLFVPILLITVMAQVPATLAGACSTVLVVAEVVVAEVAVVVVLEVVAEVAAVAGPQAMASAAELINRHCRA